MSIASHKKQEEMPANLLNPRNVGRITQDVKKKLLAQDSSARKDYLRQLVSEIKINKATASLKISYAAIARAAAEKNMGTRNGVPRLVPNWLPDLDSNQGPAD